METGKQRLRRMIRCAVWGVTAWGGLSGAAVAAPINLGTVGATGGAGSMGPAPVQSAPYQAPTKASLKATQPQSVISRHYIKHNVPPSGDYASVVKVAPSVANISPNGPGLMETQGLSIRGFQDGEYNVLFDGIPWGDSNDFTHHSTSYFMAHDLGQAQVDRGPGGASDIGYATFGGTIALQSKNPPRKASFNPYLTLGSFNTKLGGLQFNSGDIKEAGDASAFFDYQHLTSDGYLTNSGQRRQNMFFKLTKPVGDSSMLTFVAMYNQIHQNVPVGATKAQIALYGDNYGLSNDPTNQNYKGYNYDNINSDFEYLGLKSLLGNGWRLDNKVYTYSYNHKGFNGMDPNGTTPNGTYYGANDVPGEKMEMVYRSWGDILRMAKTTDTGVLKFGIWGDRQHNTRWKYTIDWTLGGALDPGVGYTGAVSGIPSAATEDYMHDTLTTVQPYVAYKWRALPGLTVTPGVKYAWFRRSLDATVNQTTGAPLNYSKTYTSALPALDLHYKVAPHWTAYAQAAKGYLAPNLNLFYTANPGASSVSPQTTWNYQIGTAWQTHRLSLGADVYYIDFNNKIGKRKLSPTDVQFYNQGGVVYKGFEAEATYYVGSGWSVYGNGSINSAKEKDSGQWIANAPKSTGAAGVIYNRNGVYGSLIDKYIGSSYGDSGQTHPLSSYNTADFSVGYTLRSPAAWLQQVRVNLQVNNLFDKRGIYAYAGGGDLYWTLPSRSYFLTLSAHI
jgi:iron complex outermembrane recepter protein